MAIRHLRERLAAAASCPATAVWQVIVATGLVLISAAALGLFSPAAQAGNRYADCGGVGQRACCAFPEFRLPACDSGLTQQLGGPGAGEGPLSCSAGTCYTTSFPSQCGSKDQRACTIFEFIPSCQSGLVERLYQGTSFCRQLDADGYPTVCGDAGERPCVVSEKIPSCKAGNYEFPLGANCQALDPDGYPEFCGGDTEVPCTLDLQLFLGIPSCKPGNFEYPLGVQCNALDGDGYPTFCGDDLQPACDLGLQVQLGITSCKAGFQEVGFPSGFCYALDIDGYPPSCGGDGEPGCTLDLQIAFGITSCKQGLTEFPSIGGTCYLPDSDGYPRGCGDLGEPPCDLLVQITQGLRSCKAPYVEDVKTSPLRVECDVCNEGFDLRCPLGGPEADFNRPPPQDWPVEEVAKGARTIFLVHGLGGNRSSYATGAGSLAAVLNDPRIDHKVYMVDYNAGNQDPSAPLRLFELIDDPDSDGYEWDEVYTSPGKGLDGENWTIAEVAALLAQAINDIDTEENISIVAHSLGGIVTRHLVYRHYDELRNAGKRIAEVVTVGSPHLGGGVGVPYTLGLGNTLQEVFGCAPADFLGLEAGTRRQRKQLCQLEKWQKGRFGVAGLGYTMDQGDYPQIEWAIIAGRGRLFTFGDISAPGLDSDGVVPTLSAFGIRPDRCFPYLILPEDPGVSLNFAVVDGKDVLSATCLQPDHLGNDSPPDYYVPELLTDAGEPQDHSEILESLQSVGFIKSILANGLDDVDPDGDGIPYWRDNCTAVANPDQRDTDGDGYGNLCDADFSNDGVVNFADLAIFRARFGTTDPDADLNGDGAVNFADLAIFRSRFGQPPGPSGTAP